MIIRLAWIFLAAAVAMSSASAADLGAMPPAAGGDLSSAGCDCGSSNMITIYDTQPGVVTRRWWADCECQLAPGARRPLKVVAPQHLLNSDSFIEPWRRN